MISYIFPFVKQNGKNFLFELFSIFDYSKKDTQNYSKFIYPYYQTGGGRGFAVSRKRESYGKNLPKGQIDERRHLEVFGKSVSGLCRVTSPFTPPPIAKKDRRFCCKFTYLFVVPKQGAVEALPFPAGGNPTAIICPKGKLTNGGIWKSSENPCRGYAALRVRLHPTNTKTARIIACRFRIGGGGRARTYDLYHVKVAL